MTKLRQRELGEMEVRIRKHSEIYHPECYQHQAESHSQPKTDGGAAASDCDNQEMRDVIGPKSNGDAAAAMEDTNAFGAYTTSILAEPGEDPGSPGSAVTS